MIAALEAGRYEEAWKGFRGLYRQDDDSPFHIWGMAITAKMVGTLSSAADEVAVKVTALRKQEIDRGGGRVPHKGTARHVVAYNLVMAIMGDTGTRNALSPKADRWYGSLFLQPLPPGEDRREMIVLYSGAMYAMNEIAKSRKSLQFGWTGTQKGQGAS
ncbi:MAG: hypothetical protein H6534_07350 [Chthonomonadaceae bacterium]|nr:hypothetical protein [Chthonomonadaceae bacterium]